MLSEVDRNTLTNLSLFQGLTPTQAAKLDNVLHCSTLPANRTIITAGRIGEAVYILLKGTVKITVDGLDDKDVILAICGAGEVLGEVSALDGIGHSANVVTLETSKFFWIDCASFRECLQTVPPLAYNLALLQARRLRRISLHAESLAMRDIYGRLAYQILAFANDYGTPVAQQTASKEGARPGDVLIPVRLTQSDLAALVGASRVSVNKVLMSFRRSKFISIDDKYHITLHNRAALAKRCQ